MKIPRILNTGPVLVKIVTVVAQNFKTDEEKQNATEKFTRKTNKEKQLKERNLY